MRYWILSLMLAGLVFSEGSFCRDVPAAEFEWTGWLGPKRDGWVAGFHAPESWPEKLEKAWQVEVGTGYGSPLVAGGAIFLHTRQGEEEVVWRLDQETGQSKWRKSFPVPFKIGSGGERHGKGPKSSPVLNDGRLFTFGITGVLSAWDAESGELLWRKDSRSRYKKPHPYWGASASPIVDGDRVIVHVGGDEEGALVAYDVTNGDEVWSQGQEGASYSSPVLVEIDGVRQVLDWNHKTLAGIDSQTGRLLWEFPFAHEGVNQNMPTPAFDEGIVILGGENRGIYGLKPARTENGWKVKKLWHQKELALDMSTPVFNDGLLYGFSHYDKGRLFCLNPRTGETLWQGPPRTGENVMFLSAPGYVIALVNSGQLKILKAKRGEYEIAAEYQLSEQPTWAPPVLLRDGFLIKDVKTLAFWSFDRAND